MTLSLRSLSGLLIFGMLSLTGCHDATPAQPVSPVVKTMRVALDPDSEQRTYTGVIQARREVEEAFRVGGRIEKRLVDVGDRVQKGQPLAILDEKDLRLSLESAQAELKAAYSNLDQAATNEKRYAELLAKSVVSQSEYDLKHLAADEAKARLEKADRALKLAKSQLDYTTLAASTDGVVTKIAAESGQVVAQGQTVVAVAQQGEMEVLVDIPERRLEDVKSSKAEISLWSNRALRYRAVLRETAPAADAAARTYAVRFSLPDADGQLRLGMTATLHLASDATAQVARIPSSALFNQGQGPGVWVVDAATGHVTLRPVTVARYSDREAFVHGQLAAGDLIVTSGAHKLDGKIPVRLAEPGQGETR
jgi:RND family efflux transporter MFP subunit